MAPAIIFVSVKKTILLLVAASVLTLPLYAINPKRIESTQKRAASENKLVAFVVEQDYYNPNCPKCIAEVDANNKQIKRMTPRKGVIVLKLEKEDLKKGDVPDCVLKTGSLPRIVITDAAGTKVIDAIGVASNKERVAEMETKIATALDDQA